jgi:phthiocerol/phenolphthiocerol synthesis type-I polyketide synthase E
LARSGIAIVGMAGRFAESQTVGEFWDNLRSGRECIGSNARIDRKSPASTGGHWVEQVNFDNRAELFDASVFGLSPREAERLEPQHRHFLELAWETLEDAGYSTEVAGANVGVFGGANFTSYFELATGSHLPEALDEMIGADKDYLATRLAHHLGLQGPAITVQSACSTSLVAVHLACQSLLGGECDAALAGGISLTRPRLTRHQYLPGGILSPDGFCRAFDAEAGGTVFTEGAGMVLLMRLEDALRRRHPIYAVIRGSAVNNDGGGKASYMAPSIAGQERVIRAALRAARVSPGEVGYIEGHGTATVLGDAIELAALTRVFREQTDDVGICGLGSVKTNIGHTASAAGVAGLMKVALALRHGVIPPNVNFKTPNPDLDFETSPFFVNAEAKAWPQRRGKPRFAGVSSFGVGGTNAHLVLQEAPRRPASRGRRAAYVLTLSARSEAALASTADRLRIRLKGASRRDLADAAYTLNLGRKALEYRAAIVCADVREAREALAGRAQSTALSGRISAGERMVAFMFPGQGSQYPGMGRQLYRDDETFRGVVDECLALAEERHGLNLADHFRGSSAEPDGSAHRGDGGIEQTRLAQPLIFVLEYALGRLLMSWGVKPSYAIGHSIGEFAAASLAGVFSLEDALKLVVARGAMMQALPAGAMLAVAAPPDAFELPADLDLASLNGPRQSVVSGPIEAIDAFAATLSQAQIHAVRLQTSHAFHSRMMEPMLDAFRQALAAVEMRAPAFPLVSNETGGVTSFAALRDPDYWTRHIRQPVLFAQGLQTLVMRGVDLLVEVGPGRQLSGLAQQNGIHRQHVRIINTMHNDGATAAELAVLTRAVSRIWLEGGHVDWAALHRAEKRRMVSLPTYPFEREAYRVEPLAGRSAEIKGKLGVADWLYLHTWRRTVLTPAHADLGEGGCWLAIEGAAASGTASRKSPIADRLRAAGEPVVTLYAAEAYARLSDDAFAVNPASVEDFESLFDALNADGLTPRKIVHAWGLEPASAREDDPNLEEDAVAFERRQVRGVYSLARCLKAHRKVYGREPLDFEIVTSGINDVTGVEILRPGAASAVAFARVAPQENTQLICRVIDVDPALLSDPGSRAVQHIVEALNSASAPVIALRQDYWWAQGAEHCPIKPDQGSRPRLRERGVYLITGGMGYIGLIFARYLAATWKARLVLVGRSPLEPDAPLAGNDTRDDDTAAPEKPSRADHVVELEALGAEVLYVQADVSVPADVSRLRDTIGERFGELNGIIFGAGSVEHRARAEEIDGTAIYDENYAGKVHGLKAVMDAFEDDELDFGVVLSSISTLLGGLGLCAYSAANHIADALVIKHRRAGHRNWITTNWDIWGDGHFAGNDRRFNFLLALAIQPDEGAQALEDILKLPELPQVIVSTHDLQSRIDVWITRSERPEDTPLVQHKRPSLATAYIEVEGELEVQIAKIWSKVLGIETIGRDDDFFEMGGHSILAVQAGVQIQELVPPDAPSANLYDTPTIRLLAAALTQPKAAAPD